MRCAWGVCWGLFALAAAAAPFTTIRTIVCDVPGTANTWGHNVTADSAGNIFIGGYSYSADHFAEPFAAKYSPFGTQEWMYRFPSNPEEGTYATALAVDSAGNVYFAGGTEYPWPASSFLIKLASDGAVLWATNWTNFTVSELAADSSNQIYATGPIWADEFGSSPIGFLLWKFAPNGETLWTKDLPLGEFGIPRWHTVAVDSSNNLYWAGVEIGKLAVEKRDAANGDVIWRADYVGSPVNFVKPKLDFDPEGNVYAVVDSFPASLLAKFNSQGQQQWGSRLYDYHAHSSAVVWNSQEALFGWRTISLVNTNGDNTSLDYLPDLPPTGDPFPINLAKTPVGQLLYAESALSNWEGSNSQRRVFVGVYARNSEPGSAPRILDITAPQTKPIGAEARISVEAEFSGDSVRRYRWFRDGYEMDPALHTNATLVLPAMTEAQTGSYWVEVRNDEGATVSHETVVDIFLPPQDSAAVTGQSVELRATRIVAPALRTEWFHEGLKILGATNNSLLLTNVSVSNAGVYRVVSYGRFGDQIEAEARLEVCDQVRLEWKATLPDFGCKGLVIDASENVSVVGTSWEGIKAAAFNSNGTLLTSFYCATGGYDFKPYAHAIAADAVGNIFISGAKHASGGYGRTIFLLSYSPRFESQHWAGVVSSSLYGVEPTHLRAEEGTAYHALQGKQRRTSRHDFYSSTRWTGATNVSGIASGGGYTSSEYLDDMQPGRNGDVYLLVRSYPNFSYGTPQLMRVRPEGGLLWKRTFGTNGVSYGKLAVDSVGNVFAVGYSVTNGYLLGGVGVMKFDTSSNLLWHVRFEDSTNVFGANATAVDVSDNLLVATDGATLKYDGQGRLLWVSASAGDFIQTDSAGNVYLARRVIGLEDTDEIEVTKLDATGARAWQLHYSIPKGGGDTVVGLSVSPGGSVYVAGTSAGNLLLLKYTSQVSANAPPVPTLPASMQVSTGETLTLSAESGIDNRFQWFFNGTAIPDATNGTLEIPSFALEFAGGYSVEVRNAFGSVMTTDTWVLPTVSLISAAANEGGWKFWANARFRYEIQYSSDLQHWTTFQAHAGTEGLIPLLLKPANAERSFFRLRVFR